MNSDKPISPAKPAAPRLKFVLLVAAEDATRHAAKWTLTHFGYLVDVTRSAEEALTLFDATLHDVVVTADAIPGITGVELAHIIKLRSPRTPVVLLARRAAPADRSCLDSVVERSARLWGLADVVQRLVADVHKS
jgi:CheY-like chemotaxis protein